MKVGKIKKATIPTSTTDVTKQNIFGFSVSNAPIGPSRTKRITVTGVPGSTFAIVAQDQNKTLYDFTGSGFNSEAAAFHGVIPLGGVFKSTINTGSATKVETMLITQDKDPEKSVRVLKQVLPNAKNGSITVDATDLSNVTVNNATVTTDKISNLGSGSIRFSSVVTAADGYYINFVRNPTFDYKSSLDFEKWDQEDAGANHRFYEDGRALINDIDVQAASVDFDKTNSKFDVVFDNVVALGGKVVASDAPANATFASRSILITGTLDVRSMGELDLDVNLILYNFIEIYS